MSDYIGYSDQYEEGQRQASMISRDENGCVPLILFWVFILGGGFLGGGVIVAYVLGGLSLLLVGGFVVAALLGHDVS